MNTIVNFEIAKLLKNKGFDLKVTHHYRDKVNYDKELFHNGTSYNFNCPEEQKQWACQLYSAPTIAETIMWLYEKHNIWTSVDYVDSNILWQYIVTNVKGNKKLNSYGWFKNPTEAYFEAILHTLKELI